MDPRNVAVLVDDDARLVPWTKSQIDPYSDCTAFEWFVEVEASKNCSRVDDGDADVGDSEWEDLNCNAR